MFTFLLKIIGVGLPSIVEQITKERTKQINAKNDSERIKSEERLKILESKKDIILNAQKGKAESYVRIAFAIPFILYIWKLVVFDKILGLGTTDGLSPTLEYILWTVLSGYFILNGIDKFKK